MNLSDKQIKQIMELADNYALDFSSSFLSTNLKASARAKIEKKLINISMRAWNIKHMPVYEHQWLMKDEDGTMGVTRFFKTDQEMYEHYNPKAILHILRESKRQVKDEDND